jgi:tetratricopeptide (TPR) repeat protein
MTESEIANSVICPSCQAVNPPYARICTSCGVDMVRYAEALPQIRELQDDQAAEHQARLVEDAATVVEDESNKGRRSLGLQVRLLLFIAALLLVFAVMGTAWYARQQQHRRQRLAMQYAKATTCLENGDYLCALENLDALLRAEPDYPDVQRSLDIARYELAKQYIETGQWEMAVSTLEALLKGNPYDIQALNLLEMTYTLWIEDAVRQKDWWTVMRLTKQRAIQFR